MAEPRLTYLIRAAVREPRRVPSAIRRRLRRWRNWLPARREPCRDDEPSYPVVDLTVGNPIPVIIAAPEFGQVVDYLRQTSGEQRSLLATEARALLYCLVRNQRPAAVVEIGTFHGGTARAICHALHANRCGTLHTVGPFDSDTFLPYLRRWPREIAQRAEFHAHDSMAFYMWAAKADLQFDLVLVDGNHDYEFASFDIQCAARAIKPGGFIFVDNVSQVGPYYAAIDFLTANPAWTECAARTTAVDPSKAFDRERTAVAGTDFIILRAPMAYTVGARPKTFGERILASPHVTGILLDITAPVTGQLHVECVLRAFDDAEQVEKIGALGVQFDGKSGAVKLDFATPLAVEDRFSAYRVEPWLIWLGQDVLELAALPVVV